MASAPTPDPPAVTRNMWTAEALAILHARLDRTALDALPLPDCAALVAAERAGDPVAIDREATAVALRLARLIALGGLPAKARAAWHIVDSDARIDFAGQLATALGAGTLEAWFASLEPRQRDYAALRSAYATETDPVRKQALARNMERWRWLPHDPGNEYLLVNAAAFRVDLWRDGQLAGSHKVVVGKVSSPTPVFSATVTGVTFNPWWDIPANIVRESVGALVARNPALARERGYVWGGGRYRQRPGPNNSLGLMKLMMPNRFSVYLHDTPSKSLFARDQRAFSHGCVRVENPLDLADTLLGAETSREDIDRIIAGGRTTDVRLARSIPIYIAYFTAEVAPDGALAFHPDVYKRDGAMGDAVIRQRPCAG